MKEKARSLYHILLDYTDKNFCLSLLVIGTATVALIALIIFILLHMISLTLYFFPALTLDTLVTGITNLILGSGILMGIGAIFMLLLSVWLGP